MIEQDNTAIELRKAIKQSFNKLYVKEFTTGWQEARMIRGIEIDLLDLSAIQQHTEAAVQDQWAFTYGFLHSRDRRLCEEWEEELAELKKDTK